MHNKEFQIYCDRNNVSGVERMKAWEIWQAALQCSPEHSKISVNIMEEKIRSMIGKIYSKWTAEDRNVLINRIISVLRG